MKKLKLISILSLLFILNVASMCSDDDDTSSQVSNPTEIASTLADGQWIVTLYKENDVVQTSNYSGYNFTFGTDSALSATNGTTTQSGDWSTYADSGYTKLDMMFTALDGPFEEISEDWNVISRTATKIELKHVSGGDGSIDYLTLEKD
ncbi:hypothetical protein [Flavobacterium channae]|uniref:hypothetical protein n=1 Tax=Flavobacterium channae TaxID=2897181 RepID=UPI001E4738D5|nr:hypothetical protein [Flavobacterium channae]UGS24282.1 hypothetical protein LOS89_03175 [Flavobacterium channae]